MNSAKEVRSSSFALFDIDIQEELLEKNRFDTTIM
jgi:hypothetical protein